MEIEQKNWFYRIFLDLGDFSGHAKESADESNDYGKFQVLIFTSLKSTCFGLLHVFFL